MSPFWRWTQMSRNMRETKIGTRSVFVGEPKINWCAVNLMCKLANTICWQSCGCVWGNERERGREYDFWLNLCYIYRRDVIQAVLTMLHIHMNFTENHNNNNNKRESFYVLFYFPFSIFYFLFEIRHFNQHF